MFGAVMAVAVGVRRKIAYTLAINPTRIRSMKRSIALLAAVLSLSGCPGYDELERVGSQDGLVPADQYARYGHEQAQAMALAREYGWAIEDTDEAGQRAAVQHAVQYAATLPDIASVTADTLGYRLTIEFRSGWRTMVTPIQDGKRGAETPNLPRGAGQAPAAGG
jgi:hypothetical protein